MSSDDRSNAVQKKLPKQPENPCEDAGRLHGSIKAQRDEKRHNQWRTRANPPGGFKTTAEKLALLG